ncbi:hypothetical protein Vch1786_I1933 [Vibrio cholerae O1 str. 2010EL-1786]|nr:hypothetical protein VCD_001913 [Vibrio cholerae MJ-1236]AET27525.1 hypothetical protein Vch1786_I1933 [Vibrio cholerae O1 str. 2010EL-1786]EEO06803.1 hypothetical protein VIF_001797 [Vibrio cholerae TM 11079-80]EEO17212.1 hypothetical protein VCE_003718 [Vibrio cholerae B33]CSB87123.1 Uncharacterised protein [Vibrio cholerae]
MFLTQITTFSVENTHRLAGRHTVVALRYLVNF